MKKFYSIALAALTLAVASCTKPEVLPENATITVSNDQAFMGENLSSNGKWAAGSNFEAYAPAVWNVETNTVTTFEGTEGSFHAINNSGVAVGADMEHALILKNGKVENLYSGADEAGAAAFDLTEDATTIVGFYFDAAWNTLPCYWDANGDRHDLPVPTDEVAGFTVNGAEARWITPDGSVILGFLIDDMGSWPAVVWRKAKTGAYEYDVICKDYFETDMGQGKPYMVFGSDAMSLSDNGEWITLVTQEEYDAWNWDVEPAPYKAARFNLTTNTLEIPEDNVDAWYGVANDGTAIGCSTNMMDGSREAFIWKAGEKQVTDFSSLYKFEELEGASVSPAYIAGNKKQIMGYALGADYSVFSFVIK